MAVSAGNLVNRTITFIRESRDELKKVTWPSRETTVRYTLIVIAGSLIVGLLIGGIDYLLTLAVNAVIN